MSASKVAFIGIGRMGWHMAGHLAKAGHLVTVCDAVEGVASKWAAYGMIQCVAKEVRSHGIRVASIFPGSVATPFWDGMGGAPWDTADMLQPDDVALAVLQVVNAPETCVIDELVVMPPKGIL